MFASHHFCGATRNKHHAALSGEEESSRFKGSDRNPRNLRTLAQQRGRCEAALPRKVQGACAASEEQADPRVRGRKSSCAWIEALKREKGIWWMPWHREAMKDVALCEKLRGGESNL